MRTRGSCWSQWDLHVHTPDSIVNHYPGSHTEAWESFISDLESLPPTFKVLGINDYIFIDGYRRILKERKSGRIANIDLVLPVIEVRLDIFGGSDSKLSRVNFHIIFSNDLDPDLIDEQFLHGLRTAYQLSPKYESLKHQWVGTATKRSLADLGQLIIKSSPEEERGNFASPLIEGFNNINFPLDKIRELLRSHYFHDKYFIAVGKSEWSDVKWKSQSIARKKDIINSADLVFTSSESPKAYAKSRAALERDGVNKKLFDCSDAHYLSTSEQKDRVGNCFTWVKGERTFAGFRHALKEFENRVYVGDEPEIRSRVRSNGSKFIESVEIRKDPDSTLDEVWFDVEIPLNPGLVAIIGNKGSGKSALAETIGLLGNTRQDEKFFSFLNPQKFRQKGLNKASFFRGSLKWANNKVCSRLLSDPVEPGSPEQVQFIPQNFLERICNEVPGGAETDFDRELKRVIYSHVESVERLGADSLDKLIELKTEAIKKELLYLRTALQETNALICDLELKSQPEYRQELQNQLNSIRESLLDLRRARPEPVPPPRAATHLKTSRDLEKRKAAHEKLLHSIRELDASLSKTNESITRLDNLAKLIELFENKYQCFEADVTQRAKELGLRSDEIISFSVNKTPLMELRKRLDDTKKHVENLLDPRNPKSLNQNRERLAKQISDLQHQLDAPNQKHQEYLNQLEKWQTERREYIGGRDKPKTALYYRARLQELKSLPQRLATLRKKRCDQVAAIHRKILEIAEEYRKLYGPIQRFIGSHPVNEEIRLSFDTTVVDTGFAEGFFDFINRNVTGSFYGTQQSNAIIEDLLATHRLNDTKAVVELTESVTERLHKDFRSSSPKPVNIADQLRKGKSVKELYDYVVKSHFVWKYGLAQATVEVASPSSRPL